MEAIHHSRVPERVAGWLLGFFAVSLLFLGQPCALLFPAVNFDATGLRIGISAVFGLLLILLIALTVRKTLPPGLGSILATIAAMGSCFFFLPRGLHGRSHLFQIPSLLIVMAPVLLILVTYRHTCNRWLRGAVIGFTTVCMLHVLLDPAACRSSIGFVSLAMMPLAFAILAKRCRLSIATAAAVAGSVWAMSVIFSFVQFRVQNGDLTGISGNRNWLACALLATTPWAHGLIRRLVTKFIPRLKSRAAAGIAAALVFLPTGFLVYRCHSRAAYLTLVVYAAFYLFFRMPTRKHRAVMLVGGAIVCILLCYALREKLDRAYRHDVRGPLWVSTGRLVLRHPFLGIGAGNLQRDLPPVLAESGYFDRYVAGEVTEHPHNELLNIAVHLGIPAALMWLILLFPAFMDPHRKPPLQKMAQFTVLMCLGMAMFDKPLTRSPMNILWLLALGICWYPYVTPLLQRNWKRMPSVPRFALVVGTGLAIVPLVLAVPEFMRSWYYRRSAQLVAAGRYQQAHAGLRKALRFVPGSAETAYAAAVISVQNSGNSKLMAEDLQAVIKINPNYAHVNRLLGRHYGRLGKPEEALAFFRQELSLFPKDSLAWQWYIRELGIQKKYGDLARAELYLRHIYHHRPSNFMDLNDTGDWSQEWIDYVRDKQWQDAMDLTSDIVSLFQFHNHVDPLAPWKRNPDAGPWSPEFLSDQFCPQDIPYWKSLTMRRPTPHGTTPQKLLEDLGNIEVVPGTPWSWPHAAMSTKKASLPSLYACYAWLLPYPSLIYDDGNVDDMFILAFVEGKILKVSLQERTIRSVDPATLASELPDDFADHAGILAFPHEFLSRHQIMDAFLSHSGRVTKRAMPTVRAQLAAEKLKKHGIALKVDAAVWQGPIKAIQMGMSRK